MFKNYVGLTSERLNCRYYSISLRFITNELNPNYLGIQMLLLLDRINSYVIYLLRCSYTKTMKITKE